MSGSEAGTVSGLLRGELSHGGDRFIALYKGVPLQVTFHLKRTESQGHFIPLERLALLDRFSKAPLPDYCQP